MKDQKIFNIILIELRDVAVKYNLMLDAKRLLVNKNDPIASAEFCHKVEGANELFKDVQIAMVEIQKKIENNEV